MDWYAHRAANALVGNPAGAATLEVTLIGPELEFDADHVFAIAGAEFGVALDGVAVAPHSRHHGKAGSRLKFGNRRRGARAYLALEGGIGVPPVFGSRATHLLSRMGGVAGRAIVAGDVLPVTPASGKRPGAPRPASLPEGRAPLRVMAGPQRHLFGREAWAALLGSSYQITPQSDRMGYRLEGPPLTHGSGSTISEATAIGSLQVPVSGQPILLMADRQTAGGYPKIATVITADLPLAGQLAPGDRIEFASCTPVEALAALRALEEDLTRGS
jgi:antagonist of KipI